MGAAVALVAGRYAGAFLLVLPGPVAGVTGAGMKGKKSLFLVTPPLQDPGICQPVYPLYTINDAGSPFTRIAIAFQSRKVPAGNFYEHHHLLCPKKMHASIYTMEWRDFS